MRVWKAVCIEKCPHGLGGGVGISSSRYPAPTLPRPQSGLGFREPGPQAAACGRRHFREGEIPPPSNGLVVQDTPFEESLADLVARSAQHGDLGSQREDCEAARRALL